MYEEHIQLILDKDIEGLLDQYTEDAVLISSFEKKPRYFRGRKELREHFQGILGIEDLQTEDRLLGRDREARDADGRRGDHACRPPQGEAKMRFADSWVLRDGKIAIHFAGMTQYPDGSVA